jgi:hypothetical protein
MSISVLVPLKIGIPWPRYEAASQQLVKKDSEMREREGQLSEVTGQLALATLQNRDHQL